MASRAHCGRAWAHEGATSPSWHFRISRTANLRIVCAKKRAGWVSGRALSGRPLTGHNVTEEHHSDSALTHRLAQQGTTRWARMYIQGGEQSARRRIMAELRDRRPRGPCRTRAIQVNRAHSVPWQLCCCYIHAAEMFLMKRGLVMQVVMCSTHRSLSRRYRTLDQSTSLCSDAQRCCTVHTSYTMLP